MPHNQPLHAPIKFSNTSRRSLGLSLTEVLVALVFLGVIVLLSLGLILPLRITRNANVETQALTYARSYMELVRTTWSNADKYQALTWPDASSANPDLKLPTGWSIDRSSSVISNAATSTDANFSSGALKTLSDTLREVTVTAKAPTGSGIKDFTIKSYIARP
jgi:Tfp pilus assembly protein PilV